MADDESARKHGLVRPAGGLSRADYRDLELRPPIRRVEWQPSPKGIGGTIAMIEAHDRTLAAERDIQAAIAAGMASAEKQARELYAVAQYCRYCGQRRGTGLTDLAWAAEQSTCPAGRRVPERPVHLRRWDLAAGIALIVVAVLILWALVPHG